MFFVRPQCWNRVLFLAETQNGWVNLPTHRKTERMYPWHLGMMWVCLKNDWTWSMMEYARISPTKWVKFWLSMGKMMTIKQWIWGYHIFRQTHSHVSRFFSGYIQTSRYHGRVSVPNRQTKSVETKPSLAVCSHDCTQTWAVKPQPLKANMYKSFSQDEVWI